MTVGEFMRQKREARNIGLHQMAKLIGFSPSHLSHIERGRDEPSEAVLECYARRLKIDKDALFLLSGRVPPDVQEILTKRPELLKLIREGSAHLD